MKRQKKTFSNFFMSKKKGISYLSIKNKEVEIFIP
jgi:hypothetical protein